MANVILKHEENCKQVFNIHRAFSNGFLKINGMQWNLRSYPQGILKNIRAFSK